MTFTICMSEVLYIGTYVIWNIYGEVFKIKYLSNKILKKFKIVV